MKFSLFAKGHVINDKRKNKLILLLLSAAMVATVLTGCAQENEKEVIDKVRQVSVYSVNEEAYRETLVYNGFINANQILPLNFQKDGKVENVFVEVGAKVKTGDLLMSLEKADASDLSSNVYAPMDGLVSQVLVGEGNLASKEYPAVILQSENDKIAIGVTSVDYQKIVKYGTPSVIVVANDINKQAKFKSIAMLPDTSTMTYAVEIEVDDSSQLIVGDLAEVRLELARVSGIWLPISYIQNDGEDYVYIVNADNRVERRNLKLNELNNDLVRVTGLSSGDRIITVGNSFVNEGQLVNAREEVHE